MVPPSEMEKDPNYSIVLKSMLLLFIRSRERAKEAEMANRRAAEARAALRRAV